MSGFARGIRLLSPVAALLATVLLHACGDDPAAPPGPDEVPAVISPAAQWSGGTITLQWPWLEGREDLPEFRSGDSVLVAERLDDDEVRLTLPEVGSGIAAIFAMIDGEAVALGDVAVAGFAQSNIAPDFPARFVYALPRDRIGIVSFTESGQVSRLDLASGQLVPLAIPNRGTYDRTVMPGVGWGSAPGRIVVPDPMRAVLQEWDLEGGAPAFVREIVVGHSGLDQVHVASDTTLIAATDDVFGFARWTEDEGAWRYDGGEHPTTPHEFYLSPAGDRIAVMMLRSASVGVPYVLDRESLRPAFYLNGIGRVEAGAFSPDGVSLYIVGTGKLDPLFRLVRYRTEDGAVLAQVALPADNRTIDNTAVAASGPWVLVAGVDFGVLRLRVLRADDLSPVAELAAPPGMVGLNDDPVFAVAPDGSRAYIYDRFPGRILSFDLLSE